MAAIQNFVVPTKVRLYVCLCGFIIIIIIIFPIVARENSEISELGFASPECLTLVVCSYSNNL